MDLLFVLNGIGEPNLILDSHGAGLNGTDSLNRHTLSGSVDNADLANATLEIQGDGVFFIRVNRNGGDFFVHSATVVVDGEQTPEPGTFALGAIGLALLLRRRFAS